MRTQTRLVALAAAVVALACGSQRDASLRADAVLSDARTDGAPGFYFLPPVAAQPGPGDNDVGLAPVVEIAALPAGPVLATFSGDAVKASDAHYMVHWSTKEYPPVAGTTYRIRVLVDGVALGFADAAVAANGRELKMLASEEVFGVTGRRTVPIKFRIEDVQADQDGDGIPDDTDLCPTVADPANLDTDADGIGDACECLNVECPAPTQCQVAVTCDATTGACLVTEREAGTPCEDGDLCTDGDSCVEGQCSPGAAAECTPPEQCQVGACDPAAGCTFTAAPDDTGCTLPDSTPGACRAGLCEATGPVKITPF